MKVINKIQITNDRNISFNVILSKNKENETLVTFYDTRYKHTEYGQQISKYYASTLLGNCEFSNGSIKDKGLNLHGGVDDWYINNNNANEVIKFIQESEVNYDRR
tara:strand:- start:655 stop:969 length:315 start_codon:yes stop_codon:yes gene_type:complete